MSAVLGKDGMNTTLQLAERLLSEAHVQWCQARHSERRSISG
jgi:hypothetical protein